MPILEIVRETPETVAKDKVFDSRLTVHNRGCAPVSSATVNEKISTGWVPANPRIKTNEYSDDEEVGNEDVELVSSSVDLANNMLTWKLGGIEEDKYAVLTYQIKSPDELESKGTLKYNMSWNGRSKEEDPSSVRTYNYTEESHLEFDLDVEQKQSYPWPEPRSAQPYRLYNYSIEVKNIGDIPTYNEWNVSTNVPSSCDVTNVYENSDGENGTWMQKKEKIEWKLPNIDVDGSTRLNFTLNCTEKGKNVLIARGERDTVTTTYLLNSTDITCSSSDRCLDTERFNFTKPKDARYENMKKADLFINYSWEAQNLTIGQGIVKITDDTGRERIVWQNYTLMPVNTSTWANYTIEGSEFVSEERGITLETSADGTYSPDVKLHVAKIGYVWETGKIFREEEKLFTKVKKYRYTPLMRNATLYINGNSSRTEGGWGERFEFGVTTRDRFGRNVTVYAWHKTSSGDSYTLVGSGVCDSCSSWTQLNFTHNYRKDEGNITSWEFKFNATNDDGRSGITGYSYSVKKDDVNANNIVPQQSSVVNRSETSTFA
ncbi:MAG: hypothetical protein ABEJ72_11305, partial [Candidatus Aenigmatarchaeota archaeon]